LGLELETAGDMKSPRKPTDHATQFAKQYLMCLLAISEEETTTHCIANPQLASTDPCCISKFHD